MTISHGFIRQLTHWCSLNIFIFCSTSPETNIYCMDLYHLLLEETLLHPSSPLRIPQCPSGSSSPTPSSAPSSDYKLHFSPFSGINRRSVMPLPSPTTEGASPLPLSRILFSSLHSRSVANDQSLTRDDSIPSPTSCETVATPVDVVSNIQPSSQPAAKPLSQQATQPNSPVEMKVEMSSRGKPVVIIDGYRLYLKRTNLNGTLLFKCNQKNVRTKKLCSASLTLRTYCKTVVRENLTHNH